MKNSQPPQMREENSTDGSSCVCGAGEALEGTGIVAGRVEYRKGSREGEEGVIPKLWTHRDHWRSDPQLFCPSAHGVSMDSPGPLEQFANSVSMPMEATFTTELGGRVRIKCEAIFFPGTCQPGRYIVGSRFPKYSGALGRGNCASFMAREISKSRSGIFPYAWGIIPMLGHQHETQSRTPTQRLPPETVGAGASKGGRRPIVARGW